VPVIPVKTPSATYDVTIAENLLRTLSSRLNKLNQNKPFRPFIITSPDIWALWSKSFLSSFKESPTVLFLPGGESHKRLTSVESLAEQLSRAGADRDSLLLAFGGGVLGDITGFLAAIYMRGIRYVQMPTTLLAQVDSSIGGKTGVNLLSGKNLLGTFHQPRAVLIDPAVLETLPSREYCAGLYESLKCGVIGDPGLFKLFEERRREILDRDPVVVEKVIADSVRLKASVVSADEREGGLRQVLNFGHTIGHALEAETRYTQLLHGEAVAWGMIGATHIALSTGKLDSVTAGRITNAVLGFGRLPRMKFQTASVLKRLRSDKKTRQGVVHFILPREIGKVEIASDVPETIVRTAIDEIRKLARN